MAGFMPGIHVYLCRSHKGVDGRLRRSEARFGFAQAGRDPLRRSASEASKPGHDALETRALT